MFKRFFLLLIILSSLTGFSQSSINREQLNSNWKFSNSNESNFALPDCNESLWISVNIPHTWNSTDITDEAKGYRRGISWYRKHFNLSKIETYQKILLQFDAVSIKADVFVNGKLAKTHIGAYTAFTVDITNLIQVGDNVIAVKADNSVSLSDEVPPVAGDFSMSGGIGRSVYLVKMNKVGFDLETYSSPGVFVETPSVSEKSAIVRVHGNIKNETAVTQRLLVLHEITDNTGLVLKRIQKALQLKPNSVSSFDEMFPELKGPKLWSPETPTLYQIHSTIKDAKTGIVWHETNNPLAFRWFKVDNTGFYLNGNKVKLRGAARHQDFEGTGMAVPIEINRKDMIQLKEMGANFVRVSHYPQDEAIYRTCDEIGLIVWSEIPIVNEVKKNEIFYYNAKEMLKEMIYQNYNHPSIVMWGYMNELWDYHDKAIELADSLENIARKIDKNRLTTVAFHAVMKDKPYTQTNREMFDISMINGVNVYEGWYVGDFKSMVDIFDKFRALSPNRPTFLSEFGAGSDNRIHTYKPQIFDFSPEYQVEFNKHYINEIERRDYYVGYSIWNFIDFHVDGRIDVQPNLNNKGIVTSDRQPKDVYYYFQARWSKKPMVHIASNCWTERTEVCDSAVLIRPISVFSNQSEVELFNNGKSLGKKAVIDGEARFEIPFVNGNNQLVAVAGKEINNVEINMNLIPSDLSKNTMLENGLCINLGQDHSYFFDKTLNQMWIPDQPYKPNSWGYVDGIKFDSWPENKAHDGVRNGVAANIKNTDLEPVFQTFQMGISEYKLDVPYGKYKIDLYFAEPFSKNEMKNFGRCGVSDNGERIFDVLINNQLLVEKLNLTKEFGYQTAVIKSFEISTKGCISIKLNSLAGKTVLSGIRIQKL
jgi:beta-galactosidase